MTQNDSSLSTATRARVSRRRSLSESANLHLLVAILEEEPVYTKSEDEVVEKVVPPQCTSLIPEILTQRSKSESVICTAQGIKFQDKYQKYQAKLDSLVALAASPASSNSNALLAKKALQYRNKTLERRRAYS